MVRLVQRALPLIILLLLPGCHDVGSIQRPCSDCGDGPALDASPDLPLPDAPRPDGPSPDAPGVDIPTVDAPGGDAPGPDAANMDLSRLEAAVHDALKPDAIFQDAAKPDAAVHDAAKSDAAVHDAAKSDAAVQDAAKPDAGALPPVTGLCSASNWCWQHPLPQGHHLNGVWGSGASDVWAVGEQGTLLHFDGKAWSAKKPIASYDFNAIAGDSTKLCAAGAKGAHYCETGSGWLPVSSGTTNDLNGVWVGGGKIILVGDAGVTQHFTGLSMANIPSYVTVNLHAVWGSGPTDVFAVGDKGTLLHFNGTAWSMAPQSSSIKEDLHAIFGLAKGHVLVAGSSGGVHRYSLTKGVEWSSKAGADTLTGIWATGTQDIHVVSQKGALYQFSSSSWSHVSAGSEELTAIWGSGSGDIHAVGNYGVMMRHFGGKWIKRSSRLTEQYLWSVSGHGPASVVAAGNQGVTLLYDGSTWKMKSSGWNSALRDVWAGGTSDMFALGSAIVGSTSSSSIYQYISSSGAWSSASFGVKQGYFLTALWGPGSGKSIAVGTESNSFVYDPAGKKWTLEKLPLAASTTWDINDIWGSSASDIYAVTANDKAGYLHHDGSNWQTANVDTAKTPGCGWYGRVWGTGANNILFLHSSVSCAARYDGKDWHLVPGLKGLGVSLGAMGGTGPSEIYMAGEAGTIMKYDKVKDFTQAEDSGTSRYLNAIWGSPTAGTYVVGSDGTILHKK